MTYTFDQLIDDVTKEAEALRVHATEEERARLDIAQFDPNTNFGCIYGLLTEYCHSDRAIELIQKCCVRYFTNQCINGIAEEGFAGVEKRVHWGHVRSLFEYRGEASKRMSPEYYSAIEAYILLPEAKNANLIAYLRGETNDLDL